MVHHTMLSRSHSIASSMKSCFSIYIYICCIPSMQKWNVTCYILHIYRCIWHLQLSALRQVAGLWWWVRRTEAILAKFWPSKVHACPEYCRAILLRYSSVVFVGHCFTFALMTTERLVKKHLNVLVGNGELSSIFNSWWLYQVRTRHSGVEVTWQVV